MDETTLFPEIVESVKNKVAKVLEVNDDTELEVIEEIILMQSSVICSYIQEDVVPDELDFVLFELSMARYNQLGAEGIEKEDRDVYSATFKGNLLSEYTIFLDNYIAKKKSQQGTPTGIRLKML